ncbi:MAG: hypothetical protein BWY83_02750 [bacterium ADurb.Bin478]|nr:MAG: hypothetical protein BWY83_02750 [bacterium ADurb.Bin478]
MSPVLSAEEKERLVQLITREVLARLRGQGAGQSQAKATDSTLSGQTLFLPNRLISSQIVQPLAGRFVQTVCITDNALITPTARDLLKEWRISVQRQPAAMAVNAQTSPQEGVVAFLAPVLYRFQWHAVLQAFNRLPYAVENIEIGGAKEMEAAAALAAGVQSGRYRAGIILDDAASSLLPILQHQDRIQPVIGWSSLNVRMRPAPLQSNVLLINRRSMGAKYLADMIAAWLAVSPQG